MTSRTTSVGDTIRRVRAVTYCFVALLLGAGAYYAMTTVKEATLVVASKATVLPVEQAIEAIQVSGHQKNAARKEVDALASAIAEGKVSGAIAQRVVAALTKGPLRSLALIHTFRAAYLPRADLSRKERDDGWITVSRFAAGLADGRIDLATREGILNEVASQTNGMMRFEHVPGSDKLRDYLRIMRVAADKAGIEKRRMSVDLALAIKKTIDLHVSIDPASKDSQ